MARSELVDLEEQGWRALSSTGEAAAEFYERVLDDTVVMLLPGGMVLDDRATIVASMSGQPWSSYELQDPRVLQPTEDTAVVTGPALRPAPAARPSRISTGTGSPGAARLTVR